MPGPDVERVLAQVIAGAVPAELESDHLDFKQPKLSAKDTIRDLTEAAVCFANGSGGTLVVGVRDQDSGESALVGCDLSIGELRRQIYESTKPGLLVAISELRVGGCRLLVIDVPEGVEVHSTSKGLASRRLGTSCLPMAATDIARLTEERSGIDWSAGLSELAMENVDPVVVRGLRRLLEGSSRPGLRELVRAPDQALLTSLSLVGSGRRLTHAGALLLAEQTRDMIVYQYRRTRAGEAVTTRRWSGPLVQVFDEVLDAIDIRQSMTPVTLRSGVQIELYDYPPAAVREALANAVVHGDHRLARPIVIEHSPDALSIVSPGPLVAGVTPQTILTSGSRARFALLLATFRNLGLAEELGHGVNRMFREMLISGRDTPTITDRGDSVQVVFRGQRPNGRVALLVHDLPVEERSDTEALLVLHLLCGRATVDARFVAPVIQRTVDDAQSALNRLSTSPVELIEATRGTAGRRYPSYRLRHHVATRLGPALSYRRRDKSELESKVVDHVREYGYINNSTLQRLFDVDVYAARDMLKDLVGRELLVRVSEQKRGTAVRYGPGPRFPQKRRGR